MNDKPTYKDLEYEIVELKKQLKFLQINSTFQKEEKKKQAKELIAVNEKAKESEKRFKLLFENSPLSYQSLDKKTNLIDVNPAWIKALGYKRKEVIGRPFRDFMTPESAEHIKERFPEFIKNGEIHNYVFEMKRKNGEIITVTYDGKIEYNELGDFEKTHCIFTDISERSQILEALQKSNDFNTSLLKTIPFGMSIIDEDRNILFINENLKKNFEQEIIGKKCWTFFKDDKVLCTKCPLSKNIKIGETSVIEIDGILGGKTVEISHTGIMFQGKKAILEVFHDITGKREDKIEIIKAKEKAEEFNDRYNKAMMATSDGLWDWNLITNEIYYSPRWKAMLGYADHELPNDFSVWEKLTEQEYVKKSWELINKHIEGKLDKFEHEFKMLHKKGHWLDILSRATAFFDEKGKAYRVVGTHADITELKKAENKLKKSERNHRKLVETMPDGVYKSTHAGKFIEVNPALVKMLGYNSKEEILAIDIKNDFYIENSERDSIILDELNQELGLFQLRKKDGSAIWIEDHAWYSFDELGKITYHEGIMRDVTERIQKEQELIEAKEKAEESDQLKTEFINNMSHEIRTPMNGIMGFSKMLIDNDIPDEKRANFVKIIQNSGQQLLNVIDDILEISRLGTKQVKVIKTDVCLNDVLLELFSTFDIKAKEQQNPLYLKKALSDAQSTIRTDKTKLNKVLSNLLENALKFTNEGFIELGYQLKNDKIELYVKDTGIGIDNSKHESIFGRFSQAEKELSKNVGGLGLGLSIAKENAELLGGSIQLESKEGKGSTFFVTIPYKPVYKDNTTETFKTEPKYTILIAEDEETNYLYIETLLKDVFGIDCKIIHVINGKDAIEACKENITIDLVLMDLKMPVMNGFEATKLIKKLCPNLPVIAQTAFSRAQEKEQAIEAGCDDFISKPIHQESFKNIVGKYFIIK